MRISGLNSSKAATFLELSMYLVAASSLLFYAGASITFWSFAKDVFLSQNHGTNLPAAVILLYSFKSVQLGIIWMTMKSGTTDGVTISDVFLRVINAFCIIVVGTIVAYMAVNQQLSSYKCTPWAAF